MKTRAFFLITSILFIFMTNTTTISALNISAGGNVTEAFSIGTTTTATLPTDWKVDKFGVLRTLGTYAGAGTATERIAGNSMSTTAQNGIYNYGAGVAGSATDRAVGWISSGTGTGSGNLYVQLTNTGTSAIANFTISYSVEKYRQGSNPAGFSIQMYYSTDGTAWTSAGSDFLTSFAADADNTGYTDAPGVTVSVSNKPLLVGLTVGNSLYLAWNYSVTAGAIQTNAQALGIDDVSITAVPLPFSGIKTVGIGGDYPTITAALAVLNSTTITGPLTFRLIDINYSSSELFPLTINPNPGSSPINTITIIPADWVSDVTISGNAAAIWHINGASYVNLSGTWSQSLTAINHNNSAPVFLIDGAASHNTIMNYIIKGSNTLTSGVVYVHPEVGGDDNTISMCNIGEGDSSPFYCVRFGGAATGRQTVQNCDIHGASFCVYVSGASDILVEANSIHDFIGCGIYIMSGGLHGEISGNDIHTGRGSSVDGILTYGNSEASFSIHDNTIYDITCAGSHAFGIFTSLAPADIYRNKIHDINYTSNYSNPACAGIYSDSATNNVYNNYIWAINAPSNTFSPALAGIIVQRGICNIYFNTVMLNASSVNESFNTASIYVRDMGISSLDMRNNIFVNNSSTGTSSTGKAVAFWKTTASTSNIASSTNTNLYYAGTPGVHNLIFYDGTNAAQTLSAYQSLIAPRELLSVTENPPFVRLTDLHISPFVPTQIESGGIPITTPFAITTDYDGDTRSATTPDIGADEGNFTNTDVTPPVNLTITRIGPNAVLHWDAELYATSYKVYWSPYPTGSYWNLRAWTSFNTFTDSLTFITNQYRFYMVKAVK
jgi:hypothetical protein